MKKLPVGRQNFAAIIRENLLYVDKTRQIYDLLDQGHLYFLSRPRRFGKSLLVSKFRYLFSGEKALFEDLHIGRQTDYDWESFPVLQFNFAKLGYEVERLAEGIRYLLKEYANKFQIQIPDVTLSLQFNHLVRSISTQEKPIVLLIDEYDKPIVDFLTNFSQAKKNQQTLKEFFSPLKDLEADGHIRFLFITGVTKFSKVSLFSDLNNLTDLSVSPLSDDLLGITHEELLFYFQDHIAAAAKHLSFSKEEMLQGIKLWYNGYSYDGKTFLYNPFSLLSFFLHKELTNYWFATGTPTFLVKSIRDSGVNPTEFIHKEVPDTFFAKFSLEELDMTGLLFQTGYLTIKEIKRKQYRNRYFLNYPNEEVRQSIMYNLVEAFTYKTPSIVGDALVKMERGLEEGNIPLFVDQLEILFSDISYHLLPRKKRNKQTEFEVWEGYFHTIIYLVTSFMNLYVQSEITKHKGRLDLLVETDDYLYLMEFKLEEPIENAIQQIKERQYAAAYKNTTKTLFLVGIAFSREERNVAAYQVEEWVETHRSS